MKIQLDFETATLNMAQKLADKDKRSRKQFLELLIAKHVYEMHEALKNGGSSK